MAPTPPSANLDRKVSQLDAVGNERPARPVVLTFTRHYLPGYRAGGPIRTIANMVERLGDRFEFRIVALDRDIGDATSYPTVPTDIWTPCGKAFVLYVPPGFGLRRVAQIVRTTPHDLIYLNSFFDPWFTQRVLVNHRLGRLFGRPIVLAVRGEFSEGALRLKWLKKSVFIWLAKLFKLYRGIIWQASSPLEAADIQRVMSAGASGADRVVDGGHIAVAPDLLGAGGVEDPSIVAPHRPVQEGALRVCFLSRICPNKNVEYALRILARVRAPVRFAIYGPIEDGAYWSRCEKLMATLPPNVTAEHNGVVEPAHVVSTLAQHDLFLFPTHGENFGHVIHEALRAGLPVLISDQTPWHGLDEMGVGWALPLNDLLAFVRRVEEVAAWSDAERQLRAARARAYAMCVAEDPATFEANRRLFLDALGGEDLRDVVVRGRVVGRVWEDE